MAAFCRPAAKATGSMVQPGLAARSAAGKLNLRLFQLRHIDRLAASAIGLLGLA
jgi:hypothetical protein